MHGSMQKGRRWEIGGLSAWIFRTKRYAFSLHFQGVKDSRTQKKKGRAAAAQNPAACSVVFRGGRVFALFDEADGEDEDREEHQAAGDQVERLAADRVEQEAAEQVAEDAGDL